MNCNTNENITVVIQFDKIKYEKNNMRKKDND